MMRVGVRPSVSRQVLEHRQDAALHQTFGDGGTDRGDLRRRGAIGTVADHRVGLAHRNVGKRQAVDIDAELGKIVRDQPGAALRGRKAGCAIAIVDRAVKCSRRIFRPVRG